MRYQIDISRGTLTLADNNGELLIIVRGRVIEDEGADWLNLTLDKQQTEELLTAIDLIKSQRPKEINKQDTGSMPYYPPGVRIAGIARARGGYGEVDYNADQ